MATLMMDKWELTRLILSQALEKLPSTRKGTGYYIELTHKNGYINDI